MTVDLIPQEVSDDDCSDCLLPFEQHCEDCQECSCQDSACQDEPDSDPYDQDNDFAADR